MSALFTTRITAERLDQFGIPSYNQDLIIQFRARITCTEQVKQEIINTFLGYVLAQLNHHYSGQKLNAKASKQNLSRYNITSTCAKFANQAFLDITRQYDVHPPLRI